MTPVSRAVPLSGGSVAAMAKLAVLAPTRLNAPWTSMLIPERRLHEGLDLLAETWLSDTGRFVHDGQLARVWIRRAIAVIHAREPAAAADCIEVHVRSWLAARPNAPAALCEAVRGVLRAVIAEVRQAAETQSLAALIGATLAPSTPTTHDNERPPPSPHLRI
jgi:hypothetical protein